MLREVGLRHAVANEPVAQRVRVGHGFLRRKRLRDDHGQRRLGIDLFEHALQIGAVDVRDEVALELRIGEVMQRMRHHLRAEVRTADADIDDMPDRFARMADPCAVADLVGEHGHLHALGLHLFRERRVDVGRAQRDVEHCALLGRIDDLAREHRIAARLDAGRFGEFDQERQRPGVDAMLGEIETEAAARDREALDALGRLLVLRRRTARADACRGSVDSALRARSRQAVISRSWQLSRAGHHGKGHSGSIARADDRLYVKLGRA